MKVYLHYLYFYVALLVPVVLFTYCGKSSAEVEATTEVFAPAKHVIVIGIDGMSPDGIAQAPTPVMDKLMAEGAFHLRARAVLPTSSSSNWASMIMGVGPEQHGITSNGWERDDYILPPVLAGNEGIAPTIFSVIRTQRPDYEIGAIYDWSGFGRLVEKSALNYDADPRGEDSTTLVAIEYIKSRKPNFLFIHLDHVDHAGHHYGHGTPEYYLAVAKADSLIGEILKAAEEAGLADDLVLLVSSDHGGLGDGHGGETPEEVEIPFLVYGKGVKSGYEINHPIYQYDNAATVAFALGAEPPYFWLGKPVKAAFSGFNQPDIKGYRYSLRSPTIQPKGKGYEPAGGLFDGGSQQVTIENREDFGTVHYTTDGTIPASSSPVYNSPFEVSTTTVVRAVVIDDGGFSSKPTEAYFRFKPAGNSHGLTYRYYEDATKSWSMLPNFKSLKPEATGNALEIRHNQIGEHREDFFGVVFEGYLLVEQAGKYKFYTASDDGSKLYINQQEVVNNDGDHGTIERSGSVELEPGYNHIKVEWFNGGGGYWLDAYYSGPGIAKQIIPVDKLFKNMPAN